ncbi:calcium-dependent protein kinase CDPK2B [Toxoplasma gondii TgCatPRC2]|uniref:Calcium-dependent protein kinase 1 n=14 Tax=Toxoplasma gondii TaxID=5811 RepID=B9QJA9_TOXGV|nr:calcium-dependent protein kinase CDPK2B [Toxoplasma gondii ME49]EPR60647.1 calcium-dependent protein kinase CDPK2B [Toxoplasma gondii GT1]ESS31542.1 calcium-dependent protein kinase CDPK2B [Toxoplasma gondii VEG]KAF4643300.1 calcium-dependent protein kinase CDPK2B [Toxoplasma gondii]KFG28979.1 calcium-dependent protein kinase CDPK2B [Toxoplasma gondii p89]KFG32819.1 calcium-dependent protein kinase CDPK2B [Toxoplasma gondii GAB2-2007-GAL-DOM2]KFG51183.1 calcium-dependent protein kinase CDP|eukprot:XP_002366770.1 calcium-dependent protein kinase CDPK2B [Toxoplasma gondii ME49]
MHNFPHCFCPPRSHQHAVPTESDSGPLLAQQESGSRHRHGNFRYRDTDAAGYGRDGGGRGHGDGTGAHQGFASDSPDHQCGEVAPRGVLGPDGLPCSGSSGPASPTNAGKFRREGFILSYSGPLTDYYDVETKKLGQGTYGSVCRAVNKATKNVRAVKTIPKAKVKNIKRFKQEIAIMKCLDHPNIIKLYETFEDHKNIYLVLELCKGGELFDRIIEEGYFSEMYAGTLMRQAFAALYYIHQHGIAHRDLKPENFLFADKSKEAPLKIIDFGLAARAGPTTVLATKAGTPYYVAPQVLQGKYTYKCDIWSAGVIMYILLCGYPPFHGDNDAEILAKVKSGKFSFNEQDWKNVSVEAKDLIRKLLTYDPAQRLTAEQALAHPWIKHYATKANPVADAPLNSKILDNFRAFRAVSKLKKAALTVIAQQMNEGQIKALKNIFLALDEDGDGTLTINEIRVGLSKSGLKEMPSDLDALMNEVDSDGSGVIDYTEFIAASLDKRQYIQEDVCWAAFRVFDLDNNGRISADELAQLLVSVDVQNMFPQREGLGQPGAEGKLTAEEKKGAREQYKLNVLEMKGLIKEVDRNGDGEIDFDEFMEMMRKGDPA